MDVPRVEVTSFLHKSAGAITNFDVTDEVASGKLLLETIADDKQKARAIPLSLPTIFSSTQTSFNFITFSQNHPHQPLSNMPRDGSGAGDNAIEAGHNIVHGDAGGVSS